MASIYKQLVEVLDTNNGNGYLTMTNGKDAVIMQIEVDAETLAAWYYEYLDNQSTYLDNITTCWIKELQP